jgi:hypothetical protein
VAILVRRTAWVTVTPFQMKVWAERVRATRNSSSRWNQVNVISLQRDELAHAQCARGQQGDHTAIPGSLSFPQKGGEFVMSCCWHPPRCTARPRVNPDSWHEYEIPGALRMRHSEKKGVDRLLADMTKIGKVEVETMNRSKRRSER